MAKENNTEEKIVKKPRTRKPRVKEVEIIKEDKVEENKPEEVIKVEPLDYDPKEILKEEKKSNRIGAIIAILLLIIAIGLIVAVFVVAINKGIPALKESNNGSKVELQYTETFDNKVEGVVITDVSNVVENVMPSIVAITSKTLINSGMFGPNFFDQENYSTGAGSGIIVSKTDKELLILTNNHVVEGTTSLSVQFINEKSIDATIKGSSVVRDIAIISRVNKPTCFKIMRFQKDSNGCDYAVLSRREVQKECREQYINFLTPGDVLPVCITRLEPFGCFVDIACGIISMIPIDFISISRISHPSDRFTNGQNIYAVVKSIDENGKITLSHKELLGSWEQNARDFNIGETVSGIIRSVEPYGIFVELTPNLAGLAEPKENVFAGQHASVYIKNLIPEKMKVKLIVIDSFLAQYKKAEPKYFIESKHIDRFVYSPKESEKVIETVF